jgi:snoRNA binding domain, fibrillarin
VATVVVAGNGPRLYLVSLPSGPASSFEWDSDPERAATRRLRSEPEDLPSDLVKTVAEPPSDAKVVSADPTISKSLAARSHRVVGVAELADLRAARSELPPVDPEVARSFVRAVARQALEQALRSPEERLVTLAREEERVARSVGREVSAIEAFSQVPGSVLESHRTTWEAAEEALADHHRRLLSALETDARNFLPNLCAVVGPRVAARLLASAGSLAALGRMSAPRLQLLGSRRRPSPDRGPRYGVLYRADRMNDLPAGRRGAYARSLSALAAIAARADALTHRDLSRVLVARRDRRVEELRRRRR